MKIARWSISRNGAAEDVGGEISIRLILGPNAWNTGRLKVASIGDAFELLKVSPGDVQRDTYRDGPLARFRDALVDALQDYYSSLDDEEREYAGHSMEDWHWLGMAIEVESDDESARAWISLAAPTRDDEPRNHAEITIASESLDTEARALLAEFVKRGQEVLR